MSSPQQGKSEWDNLTEEQRNCLIWPDFLEWGPEHHVEIKRSKGNSDLGIISVALTDVESTICYNIIKRVLKEKPAFRKVNRFDWITAVDGKSTLGIRGSEELVSLIRNGKDTVHLCIRTAIEPLLNIKQWSKEKTKVELKGLSKKPEFELAHFYSKEKNEKAEDHILIFKVESKSKAESTQLSSMQQLNRGDELLSVNGKHVTGKKLRDIYEEIFKSSKVEMDIKKIIRGEQLKEKLQKTAVKYPERIYWNPPSDSVLGANESKLGFTLNTVEKHDSENVFFHIAKEVIKGSAESGTNLSVGHQLLSINGHNLRNLDNIAASELIASQEGERRLVVAAPAGIKQQHNRRKGSISKRSQEKRSQASSRSQSSSSDEKLLDSDPNSAKLQEDISLAITSLDVGSDSSGMKEPLSPTKSSGGSRKRSSIGKKKSRVSECQENDAFASSDNDSQRTIDLCCKCEKSEEKGNFKRLDKDKGLWSLKMIDFVSFKKICDALDRELLKSDLAEVAALMEVSPQDFKDIKQKHKEKGGFGAAAEILEAWTVQKKSNNVSKFQGFLTTVKRGDILDIIDEWLKKENVCNGCGSLIN